MKKYWIFICVRFFFPFKTCGRRSIRGIKGESLFFDWVHYLAVVKSLWSFFIRPLVKSIFISFTKKSWHESASGS